MKKTWQNLIIIFLFSCFLAIPLFSNAFHLGHDTWFHIANVTAIEELVEMGKGSSLIVPSIAFDFGYGTRIFYPPLVHTITAVVGVLLNTEVAFKLVHFITIFLSGVTMYFLALKFSNKNKLALFSSLFYIAMPYFISDIYIRCAFAESLLFIFIPLILLGILYLLEGDLKHFYSCFVIGYVGGMLSHLTIMVYGTFLFGIFLLINGKTFFKKEKFIPFLKAVGSVCLLVLFFLAPLITFRILGDYAVFQEGYMSFGLKYYSLDLFDYINIYGGSNHNDVQMYFPLVVLILFIFTYFLRKRIEFPKYTKNFVVFGALALWMSSILFPWDYLPSTFQLIQFPWRIETFVVIVVSLFAPFCFTVIKSNGLAETLTIIGLVVGSILAIHFPNENLAMFDSNYIWWEAGMGWQKEYLPVNTLNNIYYFENRNSIKILIQKESSTVVNVIENNVPEIVFEVSNLKDSTIIEFPRLFYYGYELTDEDGDKISLYENSNGFLEAEISKNGTYHLKYIGFPISRAISTFSILFLSGIYYFSFIKKKEKNLKLIDLK